MNTTTTTDLLNDKIDKLTAARVNALLNEAMLPLLALPSMKGLGSTIQEFRTRLARILTPGVREKVVDEMLRALEPAPYSRPVAEDNLWDSVPPPPKPVLTLRFVVEGKEVGVFDLGASPMTFTGDVDASARSFVDNVLKMMGDASTRSKDEEIEKLQMQLTACGVAALSNTRSTTKDQRIDRTNPYWSASYQDVCDAVDREINYREALQRIAELGESPEAKNIAMVVLMHPLADLPPIPVQP